MHDHNRTDTESEVRDFCQEAYDIGLEAGRIWVGTDATLAEMRAVTGLPVTVRMGTIEVELPSVDAFLDFHLDFVTEDSDWQAKRLLRSPAFAKGFIVGAKRWVTAIRAAEAAR